MKISSQIQLYIIRTKHPKYIQLIYHLLGKKNARKTKKGQIRKVNKVKSRSS